MGITGAPHVVATDFGCESLSMEILASESKGNFTPVNLDELRKTPSLCGCSGLNWLLKPAPLPNPDNYVAFFGPAIED